MKLRLGSDTAPGTRADSPKRKSPVFTSPRRPGAEPGNRYEQEHRERPRGKGGHREENSDLIHNRSSPQPFLTVNPMQAVEINTGPNPQASVIWLHGLGADGHDFEPIVPELGLDQAGALRLPACAGAPGHDQPGHAHARLVRHPPVRPAGRGRGRRARIAAADRGADRREKERGIRPRSCSPDSPRAERSCCRPRCATASASPA